VSEIIEVDFEKRRPINRFVNNTVAEQAHADFRNNIEIIGSILGETKSLAGVKTPRIDFIDTADPDNDHPDGEVHVLRGDPDAPVVVVSDKTRSFFERNGQDREEALKSAALYATATGFAVLALVSKRASAFRSHNHNEELWQRLGVFEPRVAVKYRFGAGVINTTDTPLDKHPLVPAPGQKKIAIHVASFANPLSVIGLKDTASSYFKMS